MTTGINNVPENYRYFYSDKLLQQPMPQFLFADLALKALATSLPLPANFGLDGRSIPGTGAGYPGFDRDLFKIASDLPGNIFALGVDFNKKAGETVKINRPAWVQSSSYTTAGRELTPRQVIGTTPSSFSGEQTHLTLKRYGGPYSGGAVNPIGIEAYDANMGVLNLNDQAGKQLQYDFHKWLDAVHVELGSIGTAIYPDGMSAVNDATSDGMFPITIEQLLRLDKTMSEASLPKFADGSRLLVLTPHQVMQLKLDPDYAANSRTFAEFNILYSGNYIGKVAGFHVFESVSLSTTNNSSSVAIHYGQAFAPGAYMIGAGRPPQVRFHTSDNYGETALAIWLADLAFGVADTRFCYSVRSSA
jgi:hypothetical protein